jgi:hypothetical protein
MRTAGSCEQRTEAAVRVTHEVRPIAHQLNDVVGIA